MTGLIEFGVRKSVPITLLTIGIVIAGIWCLFSIRREFFPEANPDQVLIAIAYPGASPEEIEESMARKIEDAVANLDGVKRLRSNLAEGGGSVIVELRQGYDPKKAVDDVRVAIDALQDLPEEAERIRVTDLQPNFPTIMVSITGPDLEGDAGERLLKRAIRDVADELRTLPGMGSITVLGTRNDEVRIDVDPVQLQRHNLTLGQVTDTVRSWMRELPAGTLRTDQANVGVRTLGVKERAESIRAIPLRSTSAGQSLTVDDVATVTETFVDDQVVRRFNGSPAASLIVFKKGEEDAVRIAQMVRGFVQAKRGEPFVPSLRERIFGSDRKVGYDKGRASVVALPGTIQSHNDLARIIEGRLDLLSRNAMQGALLVFAVLLLFTNVRASFWVMTGILVAVGMTLILMRLTGTTLNLITMFGLLVVIGMLADDAIVVSDNILAHAERGKEAHDAAIDGTKQVFWPVVGTVMTTIVAFVPLAFLAGRIGELLSTLPVVAAVALGASLVESVLILPNHMVIVVNGMRARARTRIGAMWRRFEDLRESRLIPAIERGYGVLATWCLRRRYLTTSLTLAVLVVSVGMILGGRIPFTFLAADDTETAIVDLRLPIGAPLEATAAVVRRFEEAAKAQREVSAVSAILGQSANFETGVPEASATHVAQIFIELLPVEARDRRSGEVIASIRAAVGPVEEAEEVRIREITGGPAGADITYEIRGEDREQVRLVSSELKEALRGFAGVFDISDDDFSSQRELTISLRASAAGLGLSVADVARQVRGILFGLEAHVFSENREDIKVRVRLDPEARGRIDSIEGMWISTPSGRLVPLSEVAEIGEGTAYAAVRRVDRERAVTVTADCGDGTNPEEITRALAATIASLQREHPGVSIVEGGRQKDLNEAFATLPVAALAAILSIYVILAWLFSSYTQPFAVMLAIPFSVIGVVWGHWLLGYDMTFLSIIGFVALAGVVVNNSLIFVEFANSAAGSGIPLAEALVKAGQRRVRPIMLTTITTIFGLLPLLLEQSFQARFLIPMAISVTAGLASATVLTLLLLPALIVMIDDAKRFLRWLLTGSAAPRESRPAVGA